MMMIPQVHHHDTDVVSAPVDPRLLAQLLRDPLPRQQGRNKNDTGELNKNGEEY
jgi:hypothetical protein